MNDMTLPAAVGAPFERGVSPRSQRGYAAIGLDHPKCPANVGGVMRAAGCYGASMVAMAGHRFGKAPTDVQKQWRLTPVLCTEDLRLVIPYDCVPVAVDLIPGAISLTDYQHPERAFYVFGPEDGTLGERITSWCRDVVYVPMDAGCMNLAATVNVVLYDRMAKARAHLRRANVELRRDQRPAPNSEDANTEAGRWASPRTQG